VDFAVHPLLTDATSDELGVLGAEVEDENEVAYYGHPEIEYQSLRRRQGSLDWPPMVPDLRIRIARTGPIAVPLPRYQTDGAAGMDLHAAIAEPVIIAPLARARLPTGLVFAIPAHFEGQVRPRSGLAARSGVTVINSPGTIDSDYRGEVQVVLVNLSDQPATIAPLERIAQIVFAPVARAELVLMPELEATARGPGGYGSTGRH
jgi:dUTP pyrophosphatase